jgi:hypothetical protein
MTLVVAAVLIFNKINREKLLAIVRDITPDVIEPFAIQAFDMAWKAAEQKAKKIGSMTNEQKLAWAMEAAAALLAFLRTGKLTDKANEAMLEYRLYVEHQPDVAYDIPRIERAPIQHESRGTDIGTGRLYRNPNG